MQIDHIGSVLDELISTLDIPESAHDKAEARYEDLGNWLSRPDSRCAGFDPHVYPQGSFRLGTVNRPLTEDDEYDLDLGCRLRRGVTKESHSQKDLKTMVGQELEDYRTARKIENKLEEKHRCWRLAYKDEMAFHLDSVPSIPEEQRRIQTLTEEIFKAGLALPLAENITRFAGAITDNRHPRYTEITSDWHISNSEGYALWFESRMKLAMPLLEKFAAQAKARVDELPARKWKSPLQRAVQILKRHRDVMFMDNPEGEPISIIITTLAAEAYRGEQDVASAVDRILADMGKYVRSTKPRVPNPVNPSEDFADKWSNPKYKHLNLEGNFEHWLTQAQRDFALLRDSGDPDFISEQLLEKFGAKVSAETLRQKLASAAPYVVARPKLHNITEPAAKPWRRE